MSDDPTANADSGGIPAGRDPIEFAHQSAKAQYLKLQDAFRHMQDLRSELDKLGNLGDLVDPDDVVKSAATLVGKGFVPQELAVILSSMPVQSGPQLAAWIATHDEMLKAVEAQAQMTLDAAAHQLGVAAMGRLFQEHVKSAAAASTARPAAPVGERPMQTGLAISESSPTQGSA